jgi:hypothetical protein
VGTVFVADPSHTHDLIAKIRVYIRKYIYIYIYIYIYCCDLISVELSTRS